MHPESVKLKESTFKMKRHFTTILLSLVGLCLVLYAQFAYTLIQPLLSSYEESNLVATLLTGSVIVLPIPLLVLMLSWPIARLFYRSQSLSLWLLLLIGVHTTLWHSLLITIILLLSISKIAASPASFVIGLIFYSSFIFLFTGFVISIVVAVILSLFFWRRNIGNEKTGLFWSYTFGIIAIPILIYVSGAMKYPAQAFSIPSLCHAVMWKSDVRDVRGQTPFFKKKHVIIMTWLGG